MMEVEKASAGRHDRPAGGQGLGRAPRAGRRPAHQARLPHARGRARAPAHLARRRGDRRRCAAPISRARGSARSCMRLLGARQENAASTRCRRALRAPERRRPYGKAARQTAHRHDGSVGAVTQASAPLALIGVPALGAGRRADVLAAGRALRLDRERLRQGRHRADRQRSRGPHRRGARARPCRRSRRARCWCASIRSPTGWRSPRPRPSSIRRAPTVEQLKVSLRETRAEREGSREPARLSRGAGQASARPVRRAA